MHGTPTETNYGLCELRVGQTPNCSTQYNASSNVGTLEAICEVRNFAFLRRSKAYGRISIIWKHCMLTSLRIPTIPCGTLPLLKLEHCEAYLCVLKRRMNSILTNDRYIKSLKNASSGRAAVSLEPKSPVKSSY